MLRIHLLNRATATTMLLLIVLISTLGCQQLQTKPDNLISDERLENTYAPYTLNSDLSHLSEDQKSMIVHLIKAAEIMDDLFWLQSYGNKEELLTSLENESLKAFAEINYGPWDRLNADAVFIHNEKQKPLGANFYPADMTKEEFEAQQTPELKSLYTLVRRNNAGKLYALPYHHAYQSQLEEASKLLLEAAKLAEDPGFKNYLTLRAEALLNDSFMASDLAWMDMKDNAVDVVIGPIENYEDQLFGYKTAYEAYVLVKDVQWSQRLAKFAAFLPQLQRELPVDAAYKSEQPGSDSDLNAYDVIYYAGHSNAGSKTIAINLPNDESVQLQKGTRRLQLKNAMRAKFDEILIPISQQLIAPEQQKHVTFNAFFSNTMFHEVAHGLGIKNTINGKGTVRNALKEHASAQEEGKADILGLYMVEKLYTMGVLTEGELMDYYVTFMAGIFRSSRFGATSAHGVANMLRFNYFASNDAFVYNAKEGHYSVDPNRMSRAIASLSKKILKLQGDGDYQAVSQWVEEEGYVSPQLQLALDKVNQAGIPVDITFTQGIATLGLED